MGLGRGERRQTQLVCVRSTHHSRDLWEAATVWGGSCASLGELALGCVFVRGTRLLRIPGRCGQHPMPNHSFVAAAIPGVEILVASQSSVLRSPLWFHKLQLCFLLPFAFMPAFYLWSCRLKLACPTYWKWQSLSGIPLFANPWTTQSKEFSRPEYWSG